MTGERIFTLQQHSYPTVVRQRRAPLLPLLGILSLATAGIAREGSADATLKLFENRYHAAKSLAAVFLEVYRENGKVTRKEAGKAYFLRPGKMRWDYAVPEKNMFLADGKYVWFYTPEDRTVTRMPAKNSADWRTPLALLMTDMKLSRVCAHIRAVDPKPAEPGNLLYSCALRGQDTDEGAPKATGNKADSTHQVLFDLTPQGELRRIVIEEQAGIQMEFTFREWQWNPPLDKTEFQFQPPPGVVIVEGILPEAPGSHP